MAWSMLALAALKAEMIAALDGARPSDGHTIRLMDNSSAGGVRAVNRALDILMAFRDGDAQLGAAELAARVKLSRPTLYRLLTHCRRPDLCRRSASHSDFASAHRSGVGACLVVSGHAAPGHSHRRAADDEETAGGHWRNRGPCPRLMASTACAWPRCPAHMP